ncbi:MAG: molybdopterin molybdotransferase MoeA, partial [Promethearchaeota archaeon]
PINVPHFRKSRMDGYAVIAEDIFTADENNSIRLELIEQIQAGDVPKKVIKKGQTSYVATGAAIPDGADAVVMVEFSEIDGNNVYISTAVTPGTHVISIGHDIKKDEIICKKGTLIDLPTLGLISACGISNVSVIKKPLVSLISTGNELVTPDITELQTGKIYDVNSNILKKAIQIAGAEVQYLGIVQDNFEELKNAIDTGLKKSDIVILSGGTSKGEGDFGPQVLATYKNIEIMVHGVRIKPGKPFIFAKINDKVVFILPGYPTSALSCYYVFIENYIRKCAGVPLKERNSMILEVGERIYSTFGRHEFKPVKIEIINGKKLLFPIKTGSEAISTLFHANGYIEVEELEGIVEKGDQRRVFLF